MKYLILILSFVFVFSCQATSQSIGVMAEGGTPKVGDGYFFIVADSISRGGFVATMTFGRDPFYFAVGYLTQAEKDSISLIPGVDSFPKNINPNIPAGQITTIKNRFDELDIPSHFVTTSITWRQLLRFLVQYTQIGQRFYSQNQQKMISGNIAMQTLWGNLPPGAKNKLLNVATSFNMTKEGFTTNSTVGQILKGLVDQVTGAPLTFSNGIVL